MTNYISDIDHYKQVLSKILNIKRFLWIGTADIKDLYMDLSEGQLGLKTKQTLPLLG
ncbi:MAG: hypothetical protein MJ211_04760 [Bacteroidales bacterium]|nr:hypothetical protein [Bacteroidales bacterium]